MNIKYSCPRVVIFFEKSLSGITSSAFVCQIIKQVNQSQWSMVLYRCVFVSLILLASCRVCLNVLIVQCNVQARRHMLLHMLHLTVTFTAPCLSMFVRDVQEMLHTYLLCCVLQSLQIVYSYCVYSYVFPYHNQTIPLKSQ